MCSCRDHPPVFLRGKARVLGVFEKPIACFSASCMLPDAPNLRIPRHKMKKVFACTSVQEGNDDTERSSKKRPLNQPSHRQPANSSSENDERYTPRTTQQDKRYTPRTTQQDERYNTRTTQQDKKYTRRTTQQDERYTPRTTQQDERYTTRTTQQDEKYTPRKTQQDERYTSRTTQQDERYTTRTTKQPRQCGDMSRPPHGQPSASDRQAPQEDTEVQILLIGRTGNGKSSTGNTILGRSKPVFEVSTGILSATEHTQLAECDRRHGAGKIKVQVVDFPDVSSGMDEKSVKKEVHRCLALTYPSPSATCLVIRADVRFTPEECAIYRKTKELLGTRASGNLIVVFTMGDTLPTDNENSFSEQLRQTNKDLRQVLQEADNRYVLLSNVPKEHGRRISSETQKPLKAILLGPTGSGKSSTGNSLLHTNPQFRACIGFSSVTRTFEKATGTFRGHSLEIMDTPRIFTSGGFVDLVKLSNDLDQWFANLNPGPDVLLFVTKAIQDRFKDEDFELFQSLKRIFEKDIRQHLIVVFTGGDKLEAGHATVEDLLRKAPPCLNRLLEEAENRYVVFDNETRDLEKKVLQKNRLLEVMSKVAEMNQGRALNVPSKLRFIHQNSESALQGQRTQYQELAQQQISDLSQPIHQEAISAHQKPIQKEEDESRLRAAAGKCTIS